MFYVNCCLTFVSLAFVAVNYDYTVLTKVTAEIFEYCDRGLHGSYMNSLTIRPVGPNQLFIQMI